MTPLFAYGTLLRADWRRAILGSEYAAEPATLRGWRRRATPRGYLTLERTGDDGDTVEGALLALDAAAWRRADQWEEVPAYERVAVRVTTARGETEAEVYVCAEVDAREPSGAFAALGDDDVSAQIAAFVAAIPSG